MPERPQGNGAGTLVLRWRIVDLNQAPLTNETEVVWPLAAEPQGASTREEKRTEVTVKVTRSYTEARRSCTEV